LGKIERGSFVLAGDVSSFQWRDGSYFPDAIPSDGSVKVDDESDSGGGQPNIGLIAGLATVGCLLALAVLALYMLFRRFQRQLRWIEDAGDTSFALQLHSPAAEAADVLATVSRLLLLGSKLRKRAWDASRNLLASSDPHAPMLDESSDGSGQPFGERSPERQKMRDMARHFLVQTTNRAADAPVLMGDLIQASYDSFSLPNATKQLEGRDCSSRAVSEEEVGYLVDLIAGAEARKPELMAQLGKRVSFNIFDMTEVCPEQPMVLTAIVAIRSFGLIQTLRLNEPKLLMFLKQVEAGYFSVNPYHNNIHAADMLNRLVCILRMEAFFVDGSVASGCFLLSAILAAAVHDYGHPGMNNDCEVSFDTAVSRQYNEQAVLEMQSLYQTLELLRSDPRLDFMENLPMQLRRSVMSRVIQLVLATDMKRHFSIISDFKSTVS
jgi:hypothetical protein